MLHELHILVGCADARDLNQVQINAVNSCIAEYKKNNIHVEIQIIRVAGSFITDVVFEDIRSIIHDYQKRIVALPQQVSYYVHIQTHGHLTKESSEEYIGHLHEMEIVEGSLMNCGMLNASKVGLQLEALVLEKGLSYHTPNGEKHVKHDAEIREMMHEVYAYDGFLAGDWLKSIDLLRTHPRAQKAKLERLIETEPQLRRLGLKVTASIQDYAHQRSVRLDGGLPAAPWWDEVQQRIRSTVDKPESQRLQTEQQKPYVGMIGMANPQQSSRVLAARYYMRHYLNQEVAGDYLPNTIFNLAGSNFDVPSTPFDPYVVGGFFYSVNTLNLQHQIVMGADELQTNRMMAKINNDPLMQLIVDALDVKLIPLNLNEVRAELLSPML